MPFVYDPRLGGSGYRDTVTGRLISRDTVSEQIGEMIATSKDVATTLAGFVSEGTISTGSWYDAMREEIKDNYVSQYFVGIGGRERMTPADWGSVGGMLGEQYKYLRPFRDQIATGDLTEGQIAMRSRMYINSSREAYNRAVLKASDGYKTQKMWGITDAENCTDCIYFNGLGWVPLDFEFVAPSSNEICVPGSGGTECGTNCLCGLEAR